MTYALGTGFTHPTDLTRPVSLDKNLFRNQVLPQPLVLDKQVTNNALKRRNASLEIDFLQECCSDSLGFSARPMGLTDCFASHLLNKVPSTSR